MNRRELMQSLGLASAHVLFPSILMGHVAGCLPAGRREEPYRPVFFTPREFELVRKLVDIVLPATRSRSAAQTETHHFLDEVFARCLPSDQQAEIRKGLQTLLPIFNTVAGKTALLREIDRAAYEGDPAAAWFRTVKQFALVGFFTSREGTIVASNYVKIPGYYQGEVPADETTLNYGKTSLQYGL